MSTKYAWRSSVMGQLLALGIVSATTSCTHSPQQSAVPAKVVSSAPSATGLDIAALADFIEKTRIEANVVGVSVVLVKGNQTLMARGFGFADAEARMAATEKTVYRIGSVSKQFTSMGFMQLVDDKRADLDGPIIQYVPELEMQARPEDMRAITARRIMTHHSGLPGNVLKGMWSTDRVSSTDFIALAKSAHLAQKPDVIHAYSNFGLLVLGRAIENLTGTDLATHMAKSIFEPLEMSLTSYRETEAMKPHLSKGYKNGAPVVEAPINVLAAGSILSSADDLGRFIKMVLAGGKLGDRRIISERSLQEMMQVQNAHVPLDLGKQVGLGWNLNSLPAPNLGRVTHHGGGTPLFRSILVTLPDVGYGFAILTNSTSGELVLQAVTMKILDAIGNTVEGRAIAQKTPAPQPAADEHERLSCEGHFTVQNRGFIRATTKGEELHVRWKHRDLVFRRDASGDYVIDSQTPRSDRFSSGNRIHCTKLSGHYVMTAESGQRRMLVGKRFEPARIPDAWMSRVGSYEIRDRGGEMVLYDDFRITVEDGVLLLRFSMPFFEDHDGPAVLGPLSNDQARVLGLGRNTGDVISVGRDMDGEYLHYAGYALKKVR